MRKVKKNPWAQAAALARARKLSPERRSEIATIASRAAMEARKRRAQEKAAEQEPEPATA